MANLFRTVTWVTSYSLLAFLLTLIAFSRAQTCRLYPPGEPMLIAVPSCPCGMAYYSDSGCTNDCAPCPSNFTENGCYPNVNTSYSDPSTHPRCECSSGACCTAEGMFSSDSTVCMAAVDCAQEVHCSGASSDCPSAIAQPQGVACGMLAGPCVHNRTCDGSSLSCPSPTFLEAGTVCGPSSNPCVSDAVCAGDSATCPAPGVEPEGKLCANASGTCHADAYCDGVSSTCPATLPLPPGTVCANASGPCGQDSVCDGTSASCPVRAFMPKDTVCNVSYADCFLNATCSGFSADCGPLPRKPTGAECGFNTICLTAEANNTCSGLGRCILAQCTSCYNGLQGADCSCDSNPPSGGGPYRCANGIWNATGSANSPSVIVYPHSEVNILGNLTTSSLIFEGINSTISVGRCVNIGKVLILITSADFQIIDKAQGGITQPLIDFINDHNDCSTLSRTSVGLSGAYIAGCKRITARRITNEDGLAVQLKMDSSKCEGDGSSNTKWIVLGTVLGVVLIVAVIVIVIIFAFNDRARAFFSPKPKVRPTPFVS